ncbi:hypothetical protein [Sphingopyxis sp. BSNA05]|nr:hypothetical protein [Sphingopyxis sp. BSNA05]
MPTAVARSLIVKLMAPLSSIILSAAAMILARVAAISVSGRGIG